MEVVVGVQYFSKGFPGMMNGFVGAVEASIDMSGMRNKDML